MTEDACRDSGGHRPAPDLESWNPGALRRKQRSSISAVNVRSRNLALRLATKEETKGQINSGQSLQPSQPLTKSTKLPTEQLVATSQSSKQHRRAHVEQRQKNSSAPPPQISVVDTSRLQESVVFFPGNPPLFTRPSWSYLWGLQTAVLVGGGHSGGSIRSAQV